MVRYKLNEWATINYERSVCLIGKVEGHPEHEDGHVAITSKLVGQTEDGLIVTKSGSYIELGEPKADYEKTFPDAKRRLLASAPIIIEEA